VTEEPRLYRFEYLDEGIVIVNWVWLTSNEVNNYMGNQTQPSAVVHRHATKEEEELYDEAYEDGYGLAMLEEVMTNNNGLTYRIEFDKDADGELGPGDMVGHKMFECATCGKTKDLESQVAVIENGPWYLATLKDNVLWFNCYDCTSLGVDISEIELEIGIDWNSNEAPDQDKEGK
jgi:hypothetical protein